MEAFIKIDVKQLFEKELAVFSFFYANKKLGHLKIGLCMYPEEEISPLLKGKDFEYSDSGFSISQKKGITSFSLENGYEFSISIPFELCKKALEKWVSFN